jgi:hypothetical protein
MHAISSEERAEKGGAGVRRRARGSIAVWEGGRCSCSFVCSLAGGSGSGGPRSQSQILEGTLQRRDPSRGTGTVRVDAAVGPLAASSRHGVGWNSPGPRKALQQAKYAQARKVSGGAV